MKKIIGQFFLELCCSYTLVSVFGAMVNIISGTQTNNINVIMMFSFCVVACLVLNLHKLFDRFSPLFMIVSQYVIAMGLVILIFYLSALICNETITKRNMYEVFRSFTIPYVIGAAFYYYGLYIEVKNQNKILQTIQKK